MTSTRLSGLVYLSLMIVGTFNAPVALAGEPKKLNFVLISIDSLRADHMGLYGYKRNTTPYLDRFAKDAVVFDNYFSTSFMTPISEMSVHTGAYPLTNGVISFRSLLSGNIETVAEILKENGWQTVTMGSSPEFGGFLALYADFSRGFDSFKRTDLKYDRWAIPVDDTLDWMKRNSSSRKPFFLWLNVGSVHWPYGENGPAHFSDPKYNGFFKTVPHGINEWRSNFNSMYGLVYEGKRYDRNQHIVADHIGADLTYVIDRYDDGIVNTDQTLKKILDFLSDPAIAQNTVVVIQSEHGEDFGEHGYIAHYDITDTQTHVPLIIKIPGIKPGRVSSLISGVDVLPTVLDALGVYHPVKDGVSYYPYLTGQQQTAPRNDLFLTRTPLWEEVLSFDEPWLAEFFARDNREHFYDTAIRTGEWKLIHRLSRVILKQYSWYGALTGKPVLMPEYELYNIKTDPLEQRNVYAPMDPVVIQLREKLDLWEKRSREGLPRSQAKVKLQPYF